MPTHAATVELRHPKGAVTITITGASPELVVHVSNSIKQHFRPIPSLRSFDRPPRRPF